MSFALILVCLSGNVYAAQFNDSDWDINKGTGAASTATRIDLNTTGRLWIQFYGGVVYVDKNATPNIGSGIRIPDGGAIDFENNTFNYEDYLVFISESAVSYNYIPKN